VNDKSDKYVIQRFDKELKQVEQELVTEEGYQNAEEQKKEQTGEKPLNFENMCKLLKMMGFLPEVRVPESVEQ
jgi:hypothetical protein